MAIETVLFDMGNVLVHFSHDRMCKQLADVCGCDAERMRKLLIDSGLQWDFERGRINEEQFHARMEQLFERTLPFAELRHAGSDIFWENGPILPVLDRLKQQGLRLVLVSNTSISHFTYIRENFQVLDPFDDYVLSYEVGAIKPDRPMYEAALRAARCAPEQCFYTDDLVDNIHAGRLTGFCAERYEDVPTLIHSLRQHGVELE